MSDWLLNANLHFNADSGFKSAVCGFKYVFAAKRFSLSLFKGAL